MQVLFSVGGFMGSLSLEQQIIVAKKVGFDGIDYIASMQDLFFPPKKIIDLTKKQGIKVKAIHIPLYLVIYSPRFFFKSIVRLVSYFPESEHFNFHLSGFLTPLGKNVSKLGTFKQIMLENKINITCESDSNEYAIFRYYPKETYDPAFFAEFCIQHELPMTLDTSHIAAGNYDIVTFFKKNHNHINMIHLSDMNSTHQHLPFGEGELPLKELFKEIKNVSYKGSIVFEISNFNKNISEEKILKKIRNSLDMFRAYTT